MDVDHDRYEISQSDPDIKFKRSGNEYLSNSHLDLDLLRLYHGQEADPVSDSCQHDTDAHHWSQKRAHSTHIRRVKCGNFSEVASVVDQVSEISLKLRESFSFRAIKKLDY